MALVERLMALEEPRIPVHHFFSACGEIILGRLTVTNVKNFLNMNSAAQAEMDALAALMPSGTSATALANKSLWVNGVHGVFMLAEGRYPGYDTPANVRLKLGL